MFVFKPKNGSCEMSPEQMRMARAALNISMRDFGDVIGVSAAAISQYELGNESKVGKATLAKAEEFFASNKVFFGPKHGVCMGADIFEEERWYAAALFQLLKDAGAVPSSTQLIAAGSKAFSQIDIG